MKKSLYWMIIFLAFVIIAASAALAQREVDYDLYSSALKYPKAVGPKQAQKRELQLFAGRILEQPFRPIGFVLGETAEWVERTHTENKVIWFFDKLASHGVYPALRTPHEGSNGTLGPGVRIQLDKLAQIEQPFAIVNVSGGWTPNKDFAGTTVDLSTDYKIEAPTKPLYHKGIARYWRSSAESFYGIGQKSSRGEWSSYEPEELNLEGKFGYNITDNSELTSAVVYQRMNVGNGNRERIGKIKEHFGTGIPGINGGDLIGIKSIWIHDNRDFKTDPKKGGYQSFEFSYFHDTDGSNLQYLTMTGSAAHFIPIFSDRRILALRVVAEKNQKLGGDQIPFYNMARLGGTDIRDGSELLRSYAFNRYFDESLIVANAEYRYNIYEYGNFAGDAFALFDIGEVFKEVHNFVFDELKFSYGGGVNIKFRRHTILSFVLARGNEGWATSTHTHVSF